jgi:ABC-type antimicrobial peptide transport system permease subunit
LILVANIFLRSRALLAATSARPVLESSPARRFLLGAFALLALGLAGGGLYSVVSYGVAQRTNEFGIRIALRAQQKDVLRLVFGSATVSVGSGLVAGVLLKFYAARLVARWTAVNASDPLIFF